MLQQVLGGGDAGDGDGQPLLGEVGHQVDEGAVQLAEQVLLGDADVVEEQLGGVLGLLADLVEVAAALEALRAALDDEQAEPLRAALGCRLRDDDDQVGEDAVGDERLGAVQQPVVALVLRGGADALEVGAGAGLGHGDGGDDLAASRSRAASGASAPRWRAGQVRADDVVVQARARARRHPRG